MCSQALVSYERFVRKLLPSLANGGPEGRILLHAVLTEVKTHLGGEKLAYLVYKLYTAFRGCLGCEQLVKGDLDLNSAPIKGAFIDLLRNTRTALQQAPVRDVENLDPDKIRTKFVDLVRVSIKGVHNL
jgi:hypothetical protein